jgi:hypothetical protein
MKLRMPPVKILLNVSASKNRLSVFSRCAGPVIRLKKVVSCRLGSANYASCDLENADKPERWCPTPREFGLTVKLPTRRPMADLQCRAPDINYQRLLMCHLRIVYLQINGFQDLARRTVSYWFRLAKETHGERVYYI